MSGYLTRVAAAASATMAIVLISCGVAGRGRRRPESACIPVPSEVTMLLGGALAAGAIGGIGT